MPRNYKPLTIYQTRFTLFLILLFTRISNLMITYFWTMVLHISRGLRWTTLICARSTSRSRFRLAIRRIFTAWNYRLIADWRLQFAGWSWGLDGRRWWWFQGWRWRLFGTSSRVRTFRITPTWYMRKSYQNMNKLRKLTRNR